MKKPARSAAEFVPATHSLPVLREAVQSCRGCDLYHNATQAVFGERASQVLSREGHGSNQSHSHAEIMMIGEQPGDKEDLEGRPFVGPAGKLLDRCLARAGIDRDDVYITNAVKHFKWEPKGKLRLHKKPSITEIHACRPWVDAELEAVKPQLVVCLGATAAQSLLGSKFRITASHGEPQELPNLPPIVATVHPASILRARTDDDRHQQADQFIADLRNAKEFLRSVRLRQRSQQHRRPRAA